MLGHAHKLEKRSDGIGTRPGPKVLRPGERLLEEGAKLVGEFEGNRSAEEIRACADAILDDYDDVPVRSHVMTLAHKRTRDCLREATCAALR